MGQRCAHTSHAHISAPRQHEEFVVLLTETERDVVLEVGGRCLAAVRALPVAELVPGKDTPQTVSIGAAIYPDHGADLDELLRRADEALYRAKEQGRNRVVMAKSSQ